MCCIPFPSQCYALTLVLNDASLSSSLGPHTCLPQETFSKFLDICHASLHRIGSSLNPYKNVGWFTLSLLTNVESYGLLPKARAPYGASIGRGYAFHCHYPHCHRKVLHHTNSNRHLHPHLQWMLR